MMSGRRRVATKAISWDPGRNTTSEERALKSRRASLVAERQLLGRLDHPNIVKLYECFDQKEPGECVLVLELCRGGELFQRVSRYMAAAGHGLDEVQARGIFEQMLYPVCYLHASRVVHRDIKMENYVLLGEPSSPEHGVVKLCDFGTAVPMGDNPERARGRVGTLSYVAPEIYARRGAQLSADCWSLGVVLYIALIGAKPFKAREGERNEELIVRIAAADYDRNQRAFQDLSNEAKDLMTNLIVPEPSARLSSSEVMWHPWLACRRKHLSDQPRQSANLAAEAFSRFSCYAQTLLEGLHRFQELNSLEQLILVLCAQLLSEDGLIHSSRQVPWYDLFSTLDFDRDGRICIAEFVSGMAWLTNGMQLPLPLEEAARLLDVGNSGAVEWSEWLVLPLILSSHITRARLVPEPLSTVSRLISRSFGGDVLGHTEVLAIFGEIGETEKHCVLGASARWLMSLSIAELLTRLGSFEGHEPGGKGCDAIIPPERHATPAL
eukprot:NODE_3880_length_1968_cov_7.271592.p1 GENE.NODE_3880_length_1968_cov_7.271592~~NODE_3880_length_1968_cov_7.271592.p1  ORF type:complete len:495 (-),score=132.62 NODE_3880_length_1968_cov_7.271592:42-1526(-)